MSGIICSMSDGLTFPQWLKRRRGALGWTQQTLAHQVMCALVTIKRIEGGSLVPSAQLAELLADRLGVPMAQWAAFVSFARNPETAVSPPTFWPQTHPPTEPTPDTLPALLTATIGRERDIQAACALLRRPDVRLVTLTGPPGTGKTRLSIEIAQAMQSDFAAAVYFISLAPVQEPDGVIPAITQALAVPPGPGESPLANLKHHLRARRLLLVLDNFEQVVAAAPQLTELLMAASGLKLLVSSREWLRCYGEREFPVPPLEVPDVKRLPPPEGLVGYSAVALFVDRAQAVNPSFRLNEVSGPAVAQICAWLDGLPLAIEMAAARVRRFTVQEVLQQLTHRLASLVDGPRNLSPRQQTLRGAIDWSYELLLPEEQELFTAVSLFVGGASLTAVAAICPPHPPHTLHHQLNLLADKSLLRPNRTADGQVRFTMLDTLREYGQEKLPTQAQGTAVRQRFATYFLNLVEQLSPMLRRGTEAQTHALIALDMEHANLRAALEWAITAAPDPTLCLRLGLALHAYWETRGLYAEASRLMPAALARVTDPSPLRAKVLANTSLMVRWLGEQERAMALLQESFATCTQCGDEPGLAFALHHLGLQYGLQRDYVRAADYFQQALTLYQRLDQPASEASVLSSLAIARMRLGETAVATATYEASLARHRQLDDLAGVAHNLHGLAEIAIVQADLDRAARLLRESLALRYRLGHRRHLANTLEALGELLVRQGRPIDGLRLMGTAVSLRRTIGIHPETTTGQQQAIAQAQATLGATDTTRWLTVGEQLPLEEALTLVGLTNTTHDSRPNF